MAMTDTIADMLTRIRNALKAKKTEVVIPRSKMKCEIARILKEEGYIRDYASNAAIKIQLKYGPSSANVINEIKRISKPGKRVYVGKDEIPMVMNGLGVAILSTPKGVMADRKAREAGVGGELICSVY
ncbi:MAG: 30S ribosomal protein S8 [Deltaproteobacteria bacterium]|nr:30S ribosomal protein S8 [Deltaproteobacteria bacterium]